MSASAVMKRLAIAVALAATATVCSPQAGETAPLAPVAAATTPAESNAAHNAGDIPDTQAFVTFSGPGYSVLVPEGWSRTRRGSTFAFRSNANVESIELRRVSVNDDLRKRFGAVGAIGIKKHATLGTAPATLMTFRSRSDPDPVTGKRVELENALYTSQRQAMYARLLLSAPVGADNADQWKKIAGSFRWK